MTLFPIAPPVTANESSTPTPADMSDANVRENRAIATLVTMVFTIGKRSNSA
jgi:hypothetical protein